MSRAERSAAALMADDAATRWLGFTMVWVADGEATFALTVEPHHCNGHGILHGGITFALADTAFAFACNSRNTRNVAQSNSITYLAPGHVGDRLTARAIETVSQGKTGVFDVTVTRDDGTVIAEFRGLCRTIPGTLYDEDTA